jgi:hypothetical protein
LSDPAPALVEAGDRRYARRHACDVFHTSMTMLKRVTVMRYGLGVGVGGAIAPAFVLVPTASTPDGES